MTLGGAAAAGVNLDSKIRIRPGHPVDIPAICSLFLKSLDLSLPGVTFSSDPTYSLPATIERLTPRLFPGDEHRTWVLEENFDQEHQTRGIVAFASLKWKGAGRKSGVSKGEKPLPELDLM